MQPLQDLNVVVTGDVPSMTREDAKDAVIALGGRSTASVTAKTNLVIAGAGAGRSKMAKATQFRVRVLPAQDFLALAMDPGSWNGQPLGDLLSAATCDDTDEAIAGGAVAGSAVARKEPESREGPAHAVTQAVVFPNMVREVRLTCSCGHAWAGTGIHDQSKGCPQAPDGYPRGTWKPAPTVPTLAPTPTD